VDIERDPALFAEYGELIPVVMLDGERLFTYKVSKAQLRHKLEEVK